MTSITLYVVSVAACRDWPLGKCQYGAECAREHHENLDPSLPTAGLEPEGYMVPDQVNAACQRCTLRMYPCDKLGRGGEDDPCSECRWFGGEECRCILAEDTSYNDRVWSAMMNRGKDHDYTLPAAKGRDYFNLKKEVAPGPMPANKIKADWQGETKEALLAKPDMLPTGVRACPRAFLHPPRPSSAKESTQNSVISQKRKRQSDPDVDARIAPSTTSSAVPIFPPRPDFPRPPAHPEHGEVLTVSWSYPNNKWAYTYASGLKVISPPMLASIAEQNSKSTEQSGISGSFTIRPKRQCNTPRVSTTTSMGLNPAAAAAITTPTTAMSPASVGSTDTMDLRMDGYADLVVDQSADKDDDSIGYVSSDDD